jgi:hypothetical protein
MSELQERVVEQAHDVLRGEAGADWRADWAFEWAQVLTEPPEPGERCVVCHRRVNKKRTDNEPAATKETRIRGPVDLVEDNDEHLEILQEYVGADPHAYPRAQLLSKLLALGARHREELKAYFTGVE